MRTAVIIFSISVFAIALFAIGQHYLIIEEPFPVASLIHYYKEPSVPLNSIDLKVFYVVTERAERLEGWREMFDASLKKIAHFHGVQFLGKSLITYEVFPEPVVLKGDFSGARARFAEDLSVLDMIESRTPREAAIPGHHRIHLFISELHGMGGKPGAAYAPAAVFRDEALSSVRESVLYHALGHAFGLPEGDEGVMGVGAFRPLESTFLEPALVQKMGLLD